MKWFDRWFARKCKYVWDNKELLEPNVNVIGVKMSSGMAVAAQEAGVEWGDGLNINVKKVIGGFVVSFRNYDRRLDRGEQRHYLITDEQDFERELGKMITLESMKQSS